MDTISDLNHFNQLFVSHHFNFLLKIILHESFIQSIPFDFDDTELKELFLEFGIVYSAKVNSLKLETNLVEIKEATLAKIKGGIRKPLRNCNSESSGALITLNISFVLQECTLRKGELIKAMKSK